MTTEKTLSKAEMTQLALKAFDKRWGFEQLKYGDDMYGMEHLAHDVFDLVEECQQIGRIAFVAKYPA